MRYEIKVVETPSRSKGWMAYKVPFQDKLQYGTTSTEADGVLSLQIIGEVARVTRREKIHEIVTVSLAAGESETIERRLSASNRYIISITAS